MKPLWKRPLLALALAAAGSLSSSSAGCSEGSGPCFAYLQFCRKNSDCCSGVCAPFFPVYACDSMPSVAQGKLVTH